MVKKALLGQVSDADIRLLRIFRAVVACGGLTAAELELNISRSTISRHLADLEERLGLVLCRRGRGGFALTAEGRRVHESAQRLLASLDSFRGEIRDLHADLVGTLALGLFDKTVSNPDSRIPGAIAAFRGAAPAVALDITVGTSSDIESAVLDGRLHVGVVPDHRRSDSLDYAELFAERMWLYCGRGHPLFGAGHAGLAWADLHRYDYAGLGFHSPNMDAAHRAGLRRHATVNDQEAVATLVLSGCYIGFLPDHYAAAFEREGSLQRIAGAEFTYEVRFVAVTRHSPEPPRLAAAFLQMLLRAHRPQADARAAPS
jgi:DNA-binding transcriptional LysR family regulator